MTRKVFFVASFDPQLNVSYPCLKAFSPTRIMYYILVWIQKCNGCWPLEVMGNMPKDFMVSSHRA
jgi:hypothetical protein